MSVTSKGMKRKIAKISTTERKELMDISNGQQVENNKDLQALLKLTNAYRQAIKASNIKQAFIHLQNGALVNEQDIKAILWLCVNQRQSEYFKAVFNDFHSLINDNLIGHFQQFAAERSCKLIVQHIKEYFSNKSELQHNSENLIFSTNKKAKQTVSKNENVEKMDLSSKEGPEHYVALCERIHIRRNSF